MNITYQRKVKVEIRKAKNREWENKCSELENAIGYAPSVKAWRLIRNIRQNKGANSVIKFVTLDQWQSHYMRLLHEN